MVNCSGSVKIIYNYNHLLLIFDITNVADPRRIDLVPSRSKVIW
jgi:hypothetical protein